MEAQKEDKKMDKSDVLQKIPCNYKLTYTETKEYYLDELIRKNKRLQ